MPDKPDNEFLTRVAKQIVLQPRKFGVMGAYSRAFLRAEASEDYSFATDELVMRLTTSVLSGRTISAHPAVEMTVPASWWQHWKHHFDWWVSDKDELWKGRNRDGSDTTPPPWLLLLWPLLVLWPRWLRRHPVRYAKMTATLNIDQDVLYPQVDMVAQAGMPVIYESWDMLTAWEPATEIWGTRLTRESDPRFMCKGEIISAVHREMSDPGKYRGDDVWAFVDWLENHGVNIEQLVKRK